MNWVPFVEDIVFNLRDDLPHICISHNDYGICNQQQCDEECSKHKQGVDWCWRRNLGINITNAESDYYTWQGHCKHCYEEQTECNRGLPFSFVNIILCYISRCAHSCRFCYSPSLAIENGVKNNRQNDGRSHHNSIESANKNGTQVVAGTRVGTQPMTVREPVAI